ncbi:MAG: GAF domain-containing protein [Phycisphaerales bacterium]|nr:MAG: GAF domain-containing protein [Phycisphaerales bacterium]
MDAQDKQQSYEMVLGHIRALIAGETDSIAVMATVACELQHDFATFDWTGFYRVVAPGLLKVGPYQGAHGCLEIPFERGVCGAAARSRQTQVVPDVAQFPGHIACSATTRSEIVVPVIDPAGKLVAVLDIDSNRASAFDEIDRVNLETVCEMVGRSAS